MLQPRMRSRASQVCSTSTESSLETSDATFMRLAIAQAAEASAAGEVPIGAVLVMGGDVVASARNRVEELCDASAHAEMLCLRGGAAATGNWRLNAAPGSTLYVTLEPCPMCLAAVHAFRVERLVYAAPNTRLGAVESAMRFPAEHPFHSVRVTSGLLRDEAAALMLDFFRSRREAAAAEERRIDD